MVSMALKPRAVGVRDAGNGAGFTLVELLVVLAVIAILAGLLIPALSRARAAADSAVCKSNLRQIVLGLSMYADDFEIYPRSETVLGGGLARRFWFNDLENYTSARWPSNNYHQIANRVERRTGVFACPSYTRMLGVFAPVQLQPFSEPVGSYGYNRYGVGFLKAGKGELPLGLGGQNINYPVLGPEDTLPKRSTEVLVPSDMIALGDSLLSLTPAGMYPYPGQMVGSIDLSTWVFHLYMMNAGGEVGASGQLFSNLTKRRHAGRFNVAFCDGHIANLQTANFFSYRDDALRRWNFDYLPHREGLSGIQKIPRPQ